MYCIYTGPSIAPIPAMINIVGWSEAKRIAALWNKNLHKTGQTAGNTYHVMEMSTFDLVTSELAKRLSNESVTR